MFSIQRVPTLLRPYFLIWMYRRLLWTGTIHLMRTKFAGTALGWLWVWLGPILFIGLYAVVLQFLMRAQPPSSSDATYILQLIAGLAPFLMFSQAISTASGAFVEDKALLLNAVFPAELIPLRNVIASCVPLAVGISVALFVHVWLWGFSAPLIALPIVVFFFVAFIVGVVWAVSLTALVIPDVTQIINYSMMILLIATPIGYPFEVAQGILKLLVQLNPLAYFVIPMQSILARGEWPPLAFLIGGGVLGLICFHGMFIIFERVKRVALDHI